MGFCRSCGKELAEGQRFCAGCGTAAGTKLVSAPMAASSPAAAMDGTAAVPAASPIEPNVAGALAYIAGLITGIIFLAIDPYKTNSFIRFHAYQSIVFNVAWVAFWIVWTVISAILTPLTGGIFAVIDLPLILLFTLAGFGCWLFLMYQAYQQKLYRLPIVGRFAAQRAGVSL